MQSFARFVLKLFGWKVVGKKPELDQYVIIFAPHTSNWDFVLMLLVRSALNLKPNFIGKHTLFWPPFSWFLKAIGGSPVDRKKSTNVVDQIVEKFKSDPHFKLALSPEGTRSKKDHWKTGFYRVAMQADVPIQLAYTDAKLKEAGLGPILQPSGDIEKDFEWLRDFYGNKKGFRPELLSDIRIKLESKNK